MGESSLRVAMEVIHMYVRVHNKKCTRCVKYVFYQRALQRQIWKCITETSKRITHKQCEHFIPRSLVVKRQHNSYRCNLHPRCHPTGGPLQSSEYWKGMIYSGRFIEHKLVGLLGKNKRTQQAMVCAIPMVVQ